MPAVTTRALALHVAGGLLQLGDRGDGRGVRSVRVEHHRDAHRTEERLAHGREQPLAGGHVGAADEDRGVVQILRAAREDRAVHEVADRVLGDAAVAHDFVGAAVVGDDAVEDAGMRRGVELEEEFAHGRIDAEGRGAGLGRRDPCIRSWTSEVERLRAYFGLKGCLAVFEPAMTSLHASACWPARAAIDSLVAW